MTEEFIAEMKNALLTKRKSFISLLNANNDDFDRLADGGEGQDIVDLATDEIDRKMLDTLGTKNLTELRLIDAALARIEQGKYGLCQKCHKPISEARLRAIPHVVLCVDCKSKEEKRNR